MIRSYVRVLAPILTLAALGVAAAIYGLVHARLSLPFRSTYDVRAEMTAIDGVIPRLGQPVNVAGVQVGTIASARHADDGKALVTLEIDRSKLPRVYANATATLAPITPLMDMEINLDPGGAPARPLPAEGTIGVARTSVPVPLSTMLSALDTDTRTFLSSLIASLDEGTRGRGGDMRRMLLALGPTTAQMRRISDELAARREALARLVHNLARVSRAASEDRQLASGIDAGNATLRALAEQDVPLRASIHRLPGTLSVTRATLANAATFSRKLGPTLTALMPSVRRLPATLAALRRLAGTATPVLARQVRPLVREAQPLLRDAGPATARLARTTPDLISSFQVLDYFFNEIAYNPPGDDEGGLFWASWFAHNLASGGAAQDAHGPIGRFLLFGTCSSGGSFGPVFQLLLGQPNPCPQGTS